MFFVSKRILGSLSSAALCSLMVTSLTITPVLAQQPAASAALIASRTERPVTASEKTATTEKRESANLDELLITIRLLEERVKELETKLIKTEPASPAPGPAGLQPVKATAAELATVASPTNSASKSEEVKAQEVKQNEGILSFFRNTEVTGYVDAYYGFNFNRLDPQFRNFDNRHNQFAFNAAEIALEKKPTEENRVGFRMDLNYGPATEIVHSADLGGTNVFRNLQQAYVSYLVPAGKGLQVDFGKFVTPIGAEVIESKDNWNYSRSNLFSLAIPFYHAGLRLSYPVNEKLSFSGFLVNGWDSVVDNNTGKTYGVQVAVKPTANLSIIQNYMGGPEQALNNDEWRHLFDTIVTYNVNSTLSLMANYDYGRDRDLATGQRVDWQGVALYARIQANRWFAIAPRFEVFDDDEGFRTGTTQLLKGFTLTTEHKLSKNLLTRFEYRRDSSDRNFFLKRNNPLVPAQSTIGFGLVYSFSSNGDQ